MLFIYQRQTDTAVSSTLVKFDRNYGRHRENTQWLSANVSAYRYFPEQYLTSPVLLTFLIHVYAVDAVSI